jgi:hypothetical protein
MNALDLLPLQRYHIDLAIPCDEFLSRVQDVVKADSLVFVNYWEHKGQFVGRVTERGFLIRRYIRQVWVPMVSARFAPNGDKCRLEIWFFAPESLAVLIATVAFSIGLVRALGVGGLAMPLLFAIVHILGCRRFQEEIGVFRRAVGIDISANRGGTRNPGTDGT